MRATPFLLGLALSSLAAEDGLTIVRPGDRFAVIDTAHLQVLVPRDQAEALRPLAAEAEAIFARLAADARYEGRLRPTLAFTDQNDDHNGFSMVVPFPLVVVQLAPARPDSGIFAGHGEIARTLTHEFTHHIANDRNHGARYALERVFGRVLPYEPLSAVVFLLATPVHQTMPSFWQEGLAQWAETAYADPASPWSGRGRDSLTHMVWRLDAAAGGIPPANGWRLGWPEWPFGSRSYLYGMAYVRWLAGAHPGISPWRMIDEQGRQLIPFNFDSGVEETLGRDHGELMAAARQALLVEQQAQLARLRSRPVTAPVRLTPDDTRLGAPAWTGDTSLMAAVDGPHDPPRLAGIDIAEHSIPPWLGAQRVKPTGRTAWSRGEARSAGDGAVVYAEADLSTDPWRASRVVVVGADGAVQARLAGERLLQPDWKPGAQPLAAAVQLLPAASQELVVARIDDPAAAVWKRLPTTGKPWAPAFRPGRDQLAWVETDAAGSRLLLADLAWDGEQPRLDAPRTLWQVPARLIHPCWSADGRQLFVCSDLTGVANAWRLEPDTEGAAPVALTNTIGGIIACVPSPDGRRLAVIDHDAKGPFLAVIDHAPAATEPPRLDLAWPAPVARLSGPATGGAPAPLAPTASGAAASLGPATPYRGILEMRPLFWTPTTLPAPDTLGFGAAAVASDPLLTNLVVAGAGWGAAEGTPVGAVSWANSELPIDLQVSYWRSEVSYADAVLDAQGIVHPYTEAINTLEFRAGWGLAGLERRFRGWLAAGGAARHGVSAATSRYAEPLFQPTPFEGKEHYAEATLAYDGGFITPWAFAPTDGPAAALRARRTAFGGDRVSSRLGAQGSWAWTWLPDLGHQVVLGGALGWSHGEDDLQGRFGVGGAADAGMPRGYEKTQATGNHLLAWSAAYRLPLWRPYAGIDARPPVLRQVVLEGFADGAKVSRNRLNGQGLWYRSVGGELHLDLEFWMLRMAPGAGFAHQIDGKEEDVGYLTLGFLW